MLTLHHLNLGKRTYAAIEGFGRLKLVLVSVTQLSKQGLDRFAEHATFNSFVRHDVRRTTYFDQPQLIAFRPNVVKSVCLAYTEPIKHNILSMQ